MMELRLEEIVARLRGSGCRVTPQRLAIVRFLLESALHPTAQEIYEALHPAYPTMSLATVYNTLHTLTTLGEVVAFDTGSGEMRYDVRAPRSHAHFICVRCGKVTDIEHPDLMAQVQEAARHLSQPITGYRVDFFGVCDACQNR